VVSLLVEWFRVFVCAEYVCWCCCCFCCFGGDLVIFLVIFSCFVYL